MVFPQKYRPAPIRILHIQNKVSRLIADLPRIRGKHEMSQGTRFE